MRLDEVHSNFSSTYNIGEAAGQVHGRILLSGVILAPHLTSSQASTWVKTPQVDHVPLII